MARLNSFERLGAVAGSIEAVWCCCAAFSTRPRRYLFEENWAPRVLIVVDLINLFRKLDVGSRTEYSTLKDAVIQLTDDIAIRSATWASYKFLFDGLRGRWGTSCFFIFDWYLIGQALEWNVWDSIAALCSLSFTNCRCVLYATSELVADAGACTIAALGFV